jgi:hypothetical protein
LTHLLYKPLRRIARLFWQKDAGRGGNGGAAEWYMIKENKRKGRGAKRRLPGLRLL